MVRRDRHSDDSSLQSRSSSTRLHHHKSTRTRSSKHKHIIPTVVEDDEVPETSANKEVAERERHHAREYARDKTQHYFSDQIKYRRPKWTQSWFAMMNMVVACIDVSSVSSFPAKVANNGGLAFLFAYLIVMAVFVFPYMYLEGIIGQYFQISMIGIWGICPLFKGLSAGAFATCFLIAAFNPTVTTWAVYMILEGFKSIQSSSLTWATCNNLWNSCNCDGIQNTECPPIYNRTDTNTTQRTAAAEYFLAVILKIWKTKYADPHDIHSVVDNGNESLSFGFSSEEGLGSFIIPSGIILAFLFIVILIVCGSSLTTTGHIYTFTSVFPVVVLILLNCRGIGLEGAVTGISKYMKPDFKKLIDPNLWYVAAQAAFSSMSAGIGIHLATASFNPIKHDIFRDIVGTIIIDTTTRVLGCLSMFAFVGHAYSIKFIPLPDVYIANNLYFPFITFADAVAQVSGAGFFAFLYYLMIILFVLDTSTVALQTIIHALYEEYRRKYPDQSVSEATFLFGTVAFTFSLSMFTMTRGGVWVALFASDYNYHFSFHSFPAIQSIVFSWIWGLENICKAATRIYGKPPHFFLRICWKFTCPIMLVSFLAVDIATTKFDLTEELGVTPPDSAIPLAIFMTYVSVSLFVLYTIVAVFRGMKDGQGLTLLMLLISPEYEHPEIKENVWNAKRLHWKHYLFIYSHEELEEASIAQRFKMSLYSIGGFFTWACKKKKVRVQVADAGQGHHSEHHHHHHHRHHEDNGDDQEDLDHDLDQEVEEHLRAK